MDTTTRARKGFKVSCPKCGEDGSITLNVGDVGVLTCTNCEEELGAAEVREIIEGWARLLAWLDTAPALEA